MVTADGTSLAAYEAPARAAAAAVRAMLAQAAAERWGVDWEECDAERRLRRPRRSKRLASAALAAEAAEFRSARSAGAAPRAGAGAARRSRSRAATASPGSTCRPRSTAAFAFAGDVRLPGMVYRRDPPRPDRRCDAAELRREGAPPASPG